jgi:hypothetical protein
VVSSLGRPRWPDLRETDAERLIRRGGFMTRQAWDAEIEDYFAEYDSVGTDSDARGPTCSSSSTPAAAGPSARPSPIPLPTTTG